MLIREDKRTGEKREYGPGALEQFKNDFGIKTTNSAKSNLFKLYHDPAVVFIQNLQVAWSVAKPLG